MAAERRSVGAVSVSGGCTGLSRVLWIGATTKMTLYLIRHGKTVANEQHLYCGSTDLPLSNAGREDLTRCRYDIQTVRFLTSGMQRTNETLRLLFGDVPYTAEPRFREVDFGTFEMRGYDELKDDPAYQAWLSGENEVNVPPDGESGAQMQHRVLEALAELQEDTCIITHGGVIAGIMEQLFPEEGKNRYQWQPSNGHGYRLHDARYEKI